MTKTLPLHVPPFTLIRRLLLTALTLASLSRALAVDPPPNPAETAARLEAFREEVALTRSNIVQTLEQLDLIRRAQDPHAQYQKFVEQLAKMKELARLTRERAHLLKQKGDAYFADWDKRTDGTQPSPATLARRKASFDMIIKFMQQARDGFGPLVDRLEKIKKLLEGNHTKERIAAARDLFTEANWRCSDVQRALMMVEGRLDALAADFASAEPNRYSTPGKP